MSAMETEPDQMGTDNAISRKRKRSPHTNLRPSSDWTPEDSQDKARAGSDKDNADGLSKRQRKPTSEADISQDAAEALVLKHRYSSSMSLLPVEVLQHVLLFLDPFSLGRLMCVNKHLRTLLDPRQEPARRLGPETKLPFLAAEFIWSSSRRTYTPDIPHPINSVTELDMLKLIYGRSCQRCGTLPKALSSRLSMTPWNSGPGPAGVRTIWPFQSKLCANCLRPLLLKETDPMPPGLSQLQSGLPSASFTPSLHYVMSITLTQTPVPSGLHLTKYYFQPQVERMSRNVPDDHILGSTAYESWCQRFNESRLEAVTDTARLEAWELSQNPKTDMLNVPPNVSSRSSASGSSIRSDNHSKSHMTTSSGGYRAYAALSSRSGVGSSMMSASLVRQTIDSQMLPPRTESRSDQGTISSASRPYIRQDNPVSTSRPWSEHGSWDIVRLKAEKRAEIQRRCIDLIPPISPLELDGLPAFQSAVQVLMPLDERSWETLKAQLLTQRNLPGSIVSTDHHVASYPDSMETASIWRTATPAPEPIEDDPRRQAFRPIREKLYDFAREYVHRRYADGTNITHSSAPQFAADVLLYVRHRFYRNQQLEDAAFAARGEQPPSDGPSGVRARTLRLEHMRHVFESSIKPFTEFVRKDLFLCSACDTQGRHFAFEAIIQHYASKHTDTFSRGTTVVYWKAEWPSQPPFEPTPGRDSGPAGSVLFPISTSPCPVSTEPPQPRHFAASMSSGGSLERSDTGIHAHQPPNLWHENARRDGTSQMVDTYGIYSASAGTYSETHAARRHRDTGNEDPAFERPNETVRVLYPVSSVPSPVPYHHAADDQYSHQITPTQGRQVQREQWRQNSDVSMLGTSVNQAFHNDQGPSERSSRVFHDFQRRPEFGNPDENERIRPFSSSVYSRPRVFERSFMTSEEQVNPSDIPGPPDWRGYNSLHNRVRAPAQYFHELHSQQEAASDPAAVLTHNAAEDFLESFDTVATRENDKGLSRPRSGSRFLRHHSRDEDERLGATLDRRPNMSQPRSRTRIISDRESEQLQLSPVAGLDGARDNRTRVPISPETRPSSYGFRSSYRDDVSTEDSLYYNYRQPAPYFEARPYNETPLRSSRLESSGRHYDQPRSRYTDHYGRELDLPNPEIRYTDDTTQHREVRDDRSYYVDENRATSVRYDYSRNEHQEQPVWDPVAGSYYIERPVREYVLGPQYVAYEQLPARAAAYEDDTRHVRQEPERPPINDQRYPRH